MLELKFQMQNLTCFTEETSLNFKVQQRIMKSTIKQLVSFGRHKDAKINCVTSIFYVLYFYA